MSDISTDIKERDAIDFENTSVGKLFRKILIPTILGMVSIVILNFSDGAFVGHGVGSDGLAAVNIAAPIFTIFGAIGMMFGIGVSVVASVHLAHHKHKAAEINITQALVGSFLISAIIGISIVVFINEVTLLFGSSLELLPLASSYLWWIALLFPFHTIGMVGMFVIRLDGSPRYAMACSMISSGLNIFLDWLFIFPMQMGVEGAAIATSFSFGLSGLMAFIYLLGFSKNIHLYPLRMTYKSLRLSLRNLGYQIQMGFSAMLGEAAISGLMIAGNYVFIKYLYEDGVAAFGIACYYLPIVFMLANAIVQSAQPIISFGFGIGNVSRIREAMILAIKVTLVVGIFSTISILFGAKYIVQLFISAGCNAYDLAIEGLPYFSLGFVFIALNLVLVGYFQSIKQSARATIFTLLRGFILVVPSFIILPKILGSNGIWLAVPFAELLTTVIICISSRKLLILRKI